MRDGEKKERMESKGEKDNKQDIEKKRKEDGKKGRIKRR